MSAVPFLMSVIVTSTRGVFSRLDRAVAGPSGCAHPSSARTIRVFSRMSDEESAVNRLRVIVAGVIVTLILFFIAVATGAELQVRPGPDADIEEMTWINVVVLTVVAGLLAWGLAAVLDRVKNGRIIWTVISSIVLIASFGLFAQVDLDTAGLVWQASLHLVFGLIVIIGFLVYWPEQTGSADPRADTQ